MANPQIEDGHIDIANELGDVLARTYFSPAESKVLWTILRKTYGWHKKTDCISFTQFEQATGMNRRHLAPTIKRLVNRKIITMASKGPNRTIEYGLQKDYELWALLPISVIPTITQTGNIDTPETITDLGETITDLGETITQTGNETITDLSKHKSNKAITKAITKASTTSFSRELKVTFENYVQQLRDEFPELDFEVEMRKFNLYWHDGKRKLKNPKLALLNWMTRAREYKKRDGGLYGQSNQAGQAHQGSPGNRPAGAFAHLAERDREV